MIRIFNIKPTFLTLIHNYPYLLEVLTEKQRNEMLIEIDIDELKKSAESFFQTEILCQKQVLSIKHSVNGRIFTICCIGRYIEIDDEKNPFYLFLQRKFRYIFTCTMENV